ncbi:MAG TPA: hypothetical protein VHC43_09935, partial [Mycobacteriales bacterium]|nr:hypothetical protein [Mycobacteriales bacterium]
MSNGPISCRLGWLAGVLLPPPLPMQIPAVIAGGDQVLRARGASLMRGRVVKLRPSAVAAALLGPVLIIAVV